MNSSDFNPSIDAQKLREAITSKNEQVFIDIVPYRKNNQLQEIRSEYLKLNQSNNTDIIDDIQKTFSGNFKETLVAVFNTPIDFDVLQLRKAVKGLGTNDDTLIEILSTRPADVITQIKNRYQEIFPGRTLEKDISGDTSGHYKQLLLSLIEADRSQNTSPDRKECEEWAKSLYEAGEKRWGTDEKVFTELFTKKSNQEFGMIAQFYHKITGHSLLQAIDSEFSFDSKKCLKAICYGILSPSEFFAMKVKQAIKGFGTDDNLLIRVIVSRREKDMSKIKQFYKQLFKVDMITDIKNDTSGNYQKLIMDLATF